MAAKKRIMVVNDYPEFLELMRDILELEGYDVTTTPKHQNAFEQIKELKPDLVVCDLVFGNEMLGFALVDMLYLDPETRQIPLIICSGALKTVQEISPSLEAKGIRWLEKPFSNDALVEMIAKSLGEKKKV